MATEVGLSLHSHDALTRPFQVVPSGEERSDRARGLGVQREILATRLESLPGDLLSDDLHAIIFLLTSSF